MKKAYTLELGFLLSVIALSLTGFSSLFVGAHGELTAYHLLHIATSLAWLMLLLAQLVLIREKRFELHRRVGKAIFFAGPVLVATLSLLSVHSAAKDAALGRADFMLVQNVMVTLEVGLLIFLAFVLRRNRGIHGTLLLSSALLFMGIALFFTLVSYVPGFRAAPGAAPRFAAAAQAVTLVGGVVAVWFFFRNRRVGWPWLLAGSFFFINGLLQMMVARMDSTKPLTVLVASIGRPYAFALGLIAFVTMLWWAWRAAEPRGDDSGRRAAREPMKAPGQAAGMLEVSTLKYNVAPPRVPNPPGQRAA